jgi:hypothetical protein
MLDANARGESILILNVYVSGYSRREIVPGLYRNLSVSLKDLWHLMIAVLLLLVRGRNGEKSEQYLREYIDLTTHEKKIKYLIYLLQ